MIKVHEILKAKMFLIHLSFGPHAARVSGLTTTAHSADVQTEGAGVLACNVCTNNLFMRQLCARVDTH